MSNQVTTNDAESVTSNDPDTKKAGPLPQKEKDNEVLHVVALHPSSNWNADVDDALQYAKGHVTLTPEQDKRLLRKIDLRIQPLLCLVYGIQFLDKTCIAYACVIGLLNNTYLTGGQYTALGTLSLGSAFYFGYLLWELPTNRLLLKLPLAKYTACNIILGGAVLACMAACKNFASLGTVRFFFGMFESSITPGCALFASQWYRISEQGTRTGWWFCWNGVAQIVGGCLAYGMAKSDETRQLTLAGWKIIFILIGCLTMACGVLVLWVMPDLPTTARFLSEEEKVLVIERIRSNQQGIGSKHYKSDQVREAFTDPIVWTFVLYSVVSSVPVGVLNNFFSLIIRSFGFSTELSLLYNAPSGVVEFITVLGFLWLGDRYRLRLFFGMISCSICVIGMSMVYAIDFEYKHTRLIGYALTGACSTGFVVIISLICSNIAGYTKKITVETMTLVGFCVGNLIGPRLFRAQDAPNYSLAFISMIACWVCCVPILGLIWYLNEKENKRRDRICNSLGYVEKENQEFLDWTDRQNLSFRYVS